MQKIKVAFLTIAFLRGGAERVISTLSHHLHCQCMLILYERSILGYPFKGIIFELDGNIPVSNRAGRFLRRLLQLRKLLLEEQACPLISFMPRPNILALLLKRAKLYQGRIIINEVNVVSKRQIGKVMKWCIARLYPMADLIITPSHDIRNDLMDNYGVPGVRISVISNPFDVLEIVAQSHLPIEFPRPKNGASLIVAAGRLTAQKGFDLLIEAFSVIRSKSSVFLVILGDGECEASLRQLAQDRGLTSSDIHFAGWQSNPYAYFRQADLFVLSSRYEGFGNVIVEAMCCGLPVVSTDCPGGPAEILNNGEFGLLVPVNDTKALADAMLQVLQDENLRLDLAEKSLRRSSDFDISTVVKKWQEAIGCGV